MSNYKIGELLKRIDSPTDLRKLDKSMLPEVAKEVRQYIIDVISEIGNSHFGASLGVVELTIALHYVFNTPTDKLVWDVGHQAYGHKILTGRRDEFPTNRKKGGLSGFPKRSESEYDAFGVGHASTSISAVLGMAIADKLKGLNDTHHIAVIGDGALTGGLAFEGLNNAGFNSDTNLLIILNDNCMAIDPSVGALKNYLNEISQAIGSPKEEKETNKVTSELMKSLYKNANLFEALNFQYFGPIDGHDVEGLVDELERLKKIKGPKLLHCITKKGKGYKFAEEGNPTQWHSPGAFNKETGEIIKDKSGFLQPLKYQEVFGKTLLELSRMNNKIVGITPAMPSGSSLNIMMSEFPQRTFDVGIAEQHAVTFAGGLATQGILPYCVIYSTFLQRAYDEVIHDVALQNLNVVFCLDRAGLVGADGATHHGVFDIAYLRCIPNMIVASPMNESELRNLLYTAQLTELGPISIRYPRGRGVLFDWQTPFRKIKIGKGRKISEGTDLAVLTFGHVGNFAQKAVRQLGREGISVAHFDMRFVKPLDEALLIQIAEKFDKIITVEDGVLEGGFGSAVVEFFSDNGYTNRIKRLGIGNHFVEHATQEELRTEEGIDEVGIEKTVKEFL